MLDSTREIVRSALKGDCTVSALERAKLMALLRQGAVENKLEAARPPRVLKRREAATRLGGSLRFVDQLSRNGTLRKGKLPGRQRAIGFPEADVNALIFGE